VNRGGPHSKEDITPSGQAAHWTEVSAVPLRHAVDGQFYFNADFAFKLIQKRQPEEHGPSA